MANKSRRAHSHPNHHTQEELDLIRHKHRYHQHEGYAQVYRKLRYAGYKKTDDYVHTDKANEIKRSKEKKKLF